MSEREVWEKAPLIVAQFGADEVERSAQRFFDILQDTANPQDWRRVAVAVDVIAVASKQ
jgi:hypothetical protein